ncbi:MAG: DJ-1/PfpI family protein [Candidatus Micrarchaeota archaeon]
MTRVLFVIPPTNFRDEELLVPKAHFEYLGYDVTVASTKKGECYGVLGGREMAQLTLGEVNVADYNAVIFVGGSGTPLLRKEEKALQIIRDAVAKGKVFGAICWAVTTAAKAGVLKGKKVTGWVGQDEEFGMTTTAYIEQQGAKFVHDLVIVDGKIVTATGASAAQKFAEEIAKLL